MPWQAQNMTPLSHSLLPGCTLMLNTVFKIPKTYKTPAF